MYKKNVNIGPIIKRIVEERNLSKSEFSRLLGFPCRNNIYSIFQKRSIDTDLLIEISKILNYPFLNEYFEDDAKPSKQINHQILLIEADETKIKEIISMLSNDNTHNINDLTNGV